MFLNVNVSCVRVDGDDGAVRDRHDMHGANGKDDLGHR